MKLSVVIPTYNRADCLSKAIDSIINQKTNESVETIVVDDASTDFTRQVATQYISTNVKYFRLNSNRGVAFARNRGIRESRGEWISFLDSDDQFLPGALNKIISALKKQENNIEVAQFMLKAQTSEGIKTWGYKPNSTWKTYTPTYEDIVLKRGIISDMHRCVTRDVLLKNPFPDNLIGFETSYYSDLIKHGIKFKYFNQPVVKVDYSRDDHISNQLFYKSNLNLANLYQTFIQNHYLVLKKNHKLVKYEQYIGVTHLKHARLSGLTWLLKSIFHQF